MNTIKLQYGTSQHLLSQRMQAFPFLAKLLNRTFGYTNIGNYARAKVFKRHIAKVDLTKMNTILDLGCGYGENALMMAQALPTKRIIALDIDKNALTRVKYAKDKLQLNNMTLHDGKIDTLTEEGFDLIYSVDVFEHIPAEQMPFAEAFSKLKPGGYLLIKIPNKIQHTILNEKYFGEHNEWLEHEHPGQVYLLKDLVERFAKEGFAIHFAEQTDGKLSRLAWEIAYFCKKGGVLFQMLSLPFCKLLVNLDLVFNRKGTDKGNAITVIGQKIA